MLRVRLNAAEIVAISRDENISTDYAGAPKT